MADPTLATALAAALESAVNAALRYDPGSRQALGRLAGKVLALEFTQPKLRLYLIPHAEGLGLQSHYEGVVDSSLKGSPLAIVSLFRSQRLSLAGSGVEVFGSTGLLMDLQKILHNLDLDWEEAFAQVFGDVAGHQGAKALRGLGAWAEGRRQSFERLLGEYLSEELQATPARAELERFYREVDQLRLATDRLAARLEALARRRDNPPDKT